MSIHTKHSAKDCEVCAAQQEADAVGAIPTAGHHEPPAQPQAAPESIWLWPRAKADTPRREWHTIGSVEEGDVEYIRADLPRATETGLTVGAALLDEEVRVLTDYHYYEAEKAITRRGDRVREKQHLERLATIRAWAKSRAASEREGE